MERSFPRGDRPMIPRRGQFAGESSSASSTLREATVRKNYLDKEIQNFDIQHEQLKADRQASRARFAAAMRQSDLLPFYGDAEHDPERVLEAQRQEFTPGLSADWEARAELYTKDSMNEELDLLEESLVRLQSARERRRQDRGMPSYATRWREQAYNFDASEPRDFHPRTIDEQRYRDSAVGYADWRDPRSHRSVVSPAFGNERDKGHHPARKPRYKDRERVYDLENEQKIDAELDAAGLNEDYFARVRREDRSLHEGRYTPFDYRPPKTKLSAADVRNDMWSKRPRFKYPDHRVSGGKWDSRLDS